VTSTSATAEPAELLALAVHLAKAAGAKLREGQARVRTVVETKSTRTDMVTEMDRASESLITEVLRQARPHDGLLGEEGTAAAGTTGITWVVDPLDGTTNYLYEFPSWAVSIAAERDGHPHVGAVYDPVHDELFAAAHGQGATLNGQPLRITGAADLATSLVGTGFAYDARDRRRQAEELALILPSVRDIRRAGSAASDMCWVAAGRLDAYYERGTQRWDTAAGTVIVTEAGGVVEHLDDGTVVAAPPHLIDAFRTLLLTARDRAESPGP
jgi:myo-inositol-1(or 4)-monophosphatase